MTEHAVEQVGHRLEAAVGMPRRALRGTRLPVDRAHLVHVDERVEGGEVHAGEGAADGEALALEARRRRGDRGDGAVDGHRGVGIGHSRQHEDVVDGDGRHGSSWVFPQVCGSTRSTLVVLASIPHVGMVSTPTRRPGRLTDVTAQHSLAELNAGLDVVRAAPADDGTLDLIVRRPQSAPVRSSTRGSLDLAEGLVGDTWGSRPSKKSADGGPHPEMQLNVMNVRAALLVAAGDADRRALCGDQLYLDLDISEANLPPGTRVAIGDVAVIEITAEPHRGCAKFSERFGVDAVRFVNSADGRQLKLRGINAKVVVPARSPRRHRPQAPLGDRRAGGEGGRRLVDQGDGLGELFAAHREGDRRPHHEPPSTGAAGDDGDRGAVGREPPPRRTPTPSDPTARCRRAP